MVYFLQGLFNSQVAYAVQLGGTVTLAALQARSPDVLEQALNRPEMPAELREARAMPLETYRSSKTYDHNEGLSCCFRQWRASGSHCRYIHGYALAFKLVFATHELDARNWCFDFGGLKPIKAWLKETFDHTFLVAQDDPELPRFRDMAEADLIDIRILPAVGCEATAKYVFDYVSTYAARESGGRVWLESVEVHEHGGNSASYAR